VVSFTNCDALIIKNKGMAASVRSIISLCIIMIYECKLAIRSSNNFPLMAPSPPLHYRYRYGRWLEPAPRQPPLGIAPLPRPGDPGPCANSPTSYPECPPHEFFSRHVESRANCHPRPRDARCNVRSQGRIF
jgi:hypothetical protein